MTRPIPSLCVAAFLAVLSAPIHASAVAQHWDERATNGYWYQGRWTYGPPPASLFDKPDIVVGYRPWSRGGYAPPYYQSAVVADYRRFHLRRPPAGYRWILAGEDYLLIAEATGRIFDIISAR
jgi:Ni/Co efflux regulator RcnB